MAKALADIRSLARGHTEGCLATLASIMHATDAAPAARVAAANSLLDRGWGKPVQAIIGGDEGDPALQIIHTIRRIIADPKAPEEVT